MNKKLFFALLIFASSGFMAIALEYKIIQTAMKIPNIEEKHFALKNDIDELKLHLKSMTTPHKLLDAKTSLVSHNLKFAKKNQVVSIVLETKKTAQKPQEANVASMYFPLAHLFR